MFVYSQSRGTMTHVPQNGTEGSLYGTGYSGKGDNKNKPGRQDLKGLGPLPRGLYRMTRLYDSAKVGPYTIELTPEKSNQMFGRGDFRIHGDSIKSPGWASSGCIILPRAVREKIWTKGDRLLKVIE